MAIAPSTAPPPVLHARLHRLAPATACLALLVAAVWWSGDASAGFGDQDRAPLAALAPALAAALAVGASASYGPEVEAGTVRARWWLRLWPLLALAVPTTALVALAPGADAAMTVRNAIGAAGLSAGASVLAGAPLGALLGPLHAVAVWLAAPPVHGRRYEVPAWPAAEGGAPLAWAVASAVGVAGVGLWLARGPRAVRAAVG
ncbi:hypothetical protein [Streptomyces sp. KE1]|uniref:hypothetical protein n=1 Tax=Streptomyces sp. KE1 TaxID=1638939 RepID=UPI00063E96FA|nr:hypothetical protein [Streptomyces sp. KE1]KLI97120.1 hypothetical protein WQ59_25330 [Streptomyces sp. KE1]